MIKLISPGGFDFDAPAFQMIKRSSRGLIGADRIEFEKRASVDMLRQLDRLFEKTAADEPLIHMLAVGSTESYGPNRNGDGFPRVTCRRCHPSFEKFAYLYRNHKNKDPRKSYGRVLQSAFNAPMDRIELAVALNGSEKAAERNKGRFADREMEKLASGRDIPVSMACKVPFDVCSFCNHKAPSPKEYCTASSCRAGGLTEKIGAIVEVDGQVHHLHAINDHPIFFDISHVIRPADRIAYVTGMLEKQGSAPLPTSTELAAELGVHIPYNVAIDSTQSPDVQQMIKTAYELADVESSLERNEVPQTCLATGFGSVQEGKLNGLPEISQTKFASLMRALVDQRMLLPLREFVEIAADCDTEKAAEVAALTSNLLPGIYSRMISGDCFVDKISGTPYAPAPHAAALPHRVWAAKHAAAFSLKHQHVARRVTLATLQDCGSSQLKIPVATEKIATACADSVGKMAEEYAMYKLAFISAIPDSDTERQLTATLAVVQDYAS